MINVFTNYKRTLKAEWLKQRHTGMFWFCFAAAAFIPLLNTIAYFFIDISDRSEGGNGLNLFVLSNIRGFAGFFFPLFLIIMVTRIVYMEHRSDTWKLLETQPVPRFFIYFSKWEIAVLMSLVSILILFFLAILGGLIFMHAHRSHTTGSNYIEWGKDVKLVTRLWVSSLGLISLQYTVSYWIRNIALPLVFGIISLITGSIFTGFQIFNWFPYSALSLTASAPNGSESGSFFLPHELLSIAWSLLFFWMGYQFFHRKKFSRAYFTPLLALVGTCTALILFAVIFYFLNRPIVLHSYGKTVISGKILLKKPVDKLVIYEFPSYDTVVIVPVQNGAFHYSPSQNIPSKIYVARAGTDQTQIYFGNGDSMYINWTEEGFRGSHANVTGSRIAENAYLSANRYDYRLNSLSDYAYQYRPSEYYQEVADAWNRLKKNLNDFETVDNIKPRQDFIDLQKKLIAIDLVTLTDINYPKILRVYYPNDTIKPSNKLDEMHSIVRIDDTTLIGYASYREYITELLRRKALLTEQPLFSILMNDVKSEKIRNSLGYEIIQRNLTMVHDSARRAIALNESLSLINDETLRNKLIATNERLNKLQVGKKAPNFTAENLNGTEITLDNLARRYLVIDVWATWCGPCKEESPYFEQLAEEYTNERIGFISLSVDQDKSAWKAEAFQKSKRVLQLWAKNAKEEIEYNYSISAIPRFMLLDPAGNLIDADLPRPSDPRFEMELQKYIPSLRLTSY